MKDGIRETRINLDGVHSVNIYVDEENCTVVAEISEAFEEPAFFYAEKFDAPCNYIKAAIKKALCYLDKNAAVCLKNDENCFNFTHA